VVERERAGKGDERWEKARAAFAFAKGAHLRSLLRFLHLTSQSAHSFFSSQREGQSRGEGVDRNVALEQQKEVEWWVMGGDRAGCMQRTIRLPILPSATRLRPSSACVDVGFREYGRGCRSGRVFGRQKRDLKFQQGPVGLGEVRCAILVPEVKQKQRTQQQAGSRCHSESAPHCGHSNRPCTFTLNGCMATGQISFFSIRRLSRLVFGHPSHNGTFTFTITLLPSRFILSCQYSTVSVFAEHNSLTSSSTQHMK
jgi:hypothetical protein